MTQTATAEQSAKPERSPGGFVAARVHAWQQMYIARVPEALATLARLRRGVGKEAGSVPELWRYTLEGAPAGPVTGDQPTPAERAVHTAMTLFALHQQSRREPMHVAGQSLGTAVRKLRTRSPSEVAVTRRFEALGTAETLAEVVHHARGLITQLRSHNIPLDYGMFTEDLIRLQRGGGAQLRLRWGRDFYRTTGNSTSTSTDTEEPAATTATDSEEE